MSQKVMEGSAGKIHVRQVVRVGLLVALSTVGAHIKIPSITGTPALDSLPGYFAAAALGWREGALVAALGHLLTALTAGFPLSLPIHLLIAAEMGICALVFGYLFKKTNPVIAMGAAIILNGVGAPASLIPIMGPGIFYGLVTPLLVASALNIIAAALLAKAPGINRIFKGEEHAHY
ncbi:ECF transporter S component [Thermanaerosceptrum fracticalcis]|nr:ECF transporter S component [Thermanaerosceptrum fracticalcis]